jgi:hypothetical protein
MRQTLALAAVALSVGCGGGENDADGGADLSAPACTSFPSSGDLPCDVAAVLQGNCQHCHSNPPQNNAPFPEVTFEDLEQPFGTNGLHRWQRMAQVIVPGATPIHMPPPGQPQLTAAQLQTLEAWFAQCAPPAAEGTGCDGTDMSVADMSMTDGSPMGGDGGGGPTCVKNGGDCSAGQTCCANLICGTGNTCQPKPCVGLGGDCTTSSCCAGYTCNYLTYMCK